MPLEKANDIIFYRSNRVDGSADVSIDLMAHHNNAPGLQVCNESLVQPLNNAGLNENEVKYRRHLFSILNSE